MRRRKANLRHGESTEGMPAAMTLSNIRFMREKRVILDELNWTVAPREIAAVVGPNGCGKSTLLRLIAGYLWPVKGSVSLLGHRLGEYPISDLRERTGIVEATAVYPFDDTMTALDVVCSGYFSTLTISYVRPTRDQWEHSRHVLEQVALGDHAKQPFLTLSTGQRMRALIARALVKKPELVLLDEPTAGLDLPARETVLATLQRLHETGSPSIVTVTHHLEELLPGTSNVLLLGANGMMVATGSPRDVLTDKHMTSAYRWPIQVVCRHGRYHAHVDPQSWPELLASR